MKNLILMYFNVIINETYDISFQFKEEFKKKSFKNIRKINPKINGPSLEYYKYHLGEEKGKEVFDERQKYMNYKLLANFVKDNHLYSNEEQLKGIQKRVLEKKQNHMTGIINSQPKTWGNPDYISTVLRKRAESMNKLDYHIIKSRKAREYWRSDRSKLHREKISKSHKDGTGFSLVKWQVSNGVKHKNCHFFRKGKNLNYLEYLFTLILEDFKIPYEVEKHIVIDMNNYFPDIFIPELNLIIELFGDIWHCNPSLVRIFKNDKENSPFKEDPEKVWDRDKKRQDNFLKAGYRYLVFWENDFNFGRLERIYSFLQKIKEELNEYYIRKN